MTIERLDPDSLFQMEGFHQVVKANGFAFIAGQGAFDREMNLVGPGDHEAQTVQALANLRAAVEAAGTTVDRIVSTTIHVVGLDGDTTGRVTQGLAKGLDGTPFPSHAMSIIGTPALALEGMLIEIVAVAALPES
jgi:enamine deaminase RidA (YjgF/YER057c/UK114 family)